MFEKKTWYANALRGSQVRMENGTDKRERLKRKEEKIQALNDSRSYE